MVLKWLKAVLRRKGKRSTRSVDVEIETEISGIGDTPTLSSVNSETGEREDIVEDSRIGLKWLMAVFKRRDRYEYVQTETVTSRRSNTRSISGVDSRAGEPVAVIEHHRRGAHRFGVIGNILTGVRASRRLSELERDGGSSSSYYTISTISSVSSIVGSNIDASVYSSEDLSIRDLEENPLLLPQDIVISRIYRLLKVFEIRVLEILPGDEEIVRCRLKYTSITTPRDYNALSYTWGNTLQFKIIMINGYPLQVTENCEAALKELRQEASIKQKRQIIWIDAICINQTDVSERTQQVRLMRHIYHKCQKLIVWLGPEGDGSSDAVQSMKEMAAFCEDGTVHEWAETFVKDPNYADRWVCIIKLISRSWFARAWVFQEYVICARKAHSQPDTDAVEFYCGKDRISPHAMGLTSESSGRIGSMLSKVGLEKPELIAIWAKEGEKILRGLYSLVSLSIYSQLGILSPIQFFSCILSNLYRFATDPRDHIYAYLGFCNQMDVWLQVWENMVPGFTDLIVDYGASIGDVFSSLVQLMVSTSGRLDVLSMCYKRNSQIKISWALDLQDMASFRQGREIEKHQGLLGAQFLNRSVQRRYFASKDKLESAFFSKAPATLLVTGFRFELVYSVFEVDDTPMWEVMTTGKSVIERLSRYLASMTGKKNEEGRRVLWDISVGGTSFEDKPGYYESWTEWLDLPPVPGGEDKYDTHEHWAKLMKEQSPDRTICFLKNLKTWPITRIVKGWKTMRENDIVCIVFGCDVPLVLRPVDGHFELIGDCYVEGIMEGQAMDLLENEKVKEESFPIY